MLQDLYKLRMLAKTLEYYEIYFDKEIKVISFGKDDIRINIYYSTGTVGTCLNYPRQQSKQQLFQRNVDFKTVRQIFYNPQIYTNSIYQSYKNYDNNNNNKRRRIDSNDNNNDSSSNTNTNKNKFLPGDHVYVKERAMNAIIKSEIITDKKSHNNGQILVQYNVDEKISYVTPDQLISASIVLNEKDEVQQSLNLLDNTFNKILDEEKIKLKTIITTYDVEQERKVEQMEQERIKELEQVQAKRGLFFNYNLYEDTDGQIDRMFNKTVTCIACGGKATIMLYDNGKWAATDGLPPLLSLSLNNTFINNNKSSSQQPPANSRNPTYIALGSQKRYYVKFTITYNNNNNNTDNNTITTSEKSEWSGCGGNFITLMNEKDTTYIKTVTFGTEWDSYFIVYIDGTYDYNNIPEKLLKIIQTIGKNNNKSKKKKKTDNNNNNNIDCVSLGPSGEYYLRVQNTGQSYIGGMTTENLNKLSTLKDRIKFLTFGDDNTYIARYE